jgi:predicted nucleic acid-binding protein
MAFVLDASVAITWAFLEEDLAAAVASLKRLDAEAAIVPIAWWFEVRNVLLHNERRQRISEADAGSFLHVIGTLDIEIDRSPDEAALMTLGRRHRLTVYDAAYLELALRRVVPLATLDRTLAEAARREGISLIG